MLLPLDEKSKRELANMPDVIFGLAIIGGLWLYFIPTIVAIIRRTKRRATIFSVNLIFGWTVAGWIATVIWVMAERPSLEPDLARSSPVETDTWSFDPSKLSDRSVEQRDDWVLGLENFVKSPQKMS
jgi:hypothetical protein